MQQEPGAELRMETFRAGLSSDGSRPDDRTDAWLQAVDLGFHEPAGEPKHAAAVVRAYRADDRVLTGVYDDGPAGGHAWYPGAPVATYATLVNDLNVGGRMVPAHQITMVTVRPTHRRRGILRSMITADLERAKAAGFSLAALGASEAVIYGRFGFGVATSEATVEVDTRGRLELRTAPTGTTVYADPGKLEALAPEIFARHLAATRGALGRQYSYAKRASGSWGDDPEPDRHVRAAVHYDADGTPAGYASFKFLPWDKEPHTLKLVDLVAVTDSAALELWRFLGSIDLVERISWSRAPEADPLPWALADRRRYQVRSLDDQLWLRALDPAAMLAARGWEADGELQLTITDPLGLASGSWGLRVRNGVAEVVDAAAAGVGRLPQAELDATAFASLYLGGVSAGVLAAAGEVRAGSAALEVLERLFAVSRPPYCSTHF